MSNANNKSFVVKTPTSELQKLWVNGFFKEWQSYANVVTAFEEVGCHFKQSALSMALKRSKFLTPKGAGKTLQYIQSYPYESES